MPVYKGSNLLYRIKAKNKNIIQVYKGTAGQYNNFKVENISHSIIFSYDIEKGQTKQNLGSHS